MPEVIDHTDIEGAVSQLAALSGAPYAAVFAAVRECAPGGGGDELSLARGVTTVAEALAQNGVDLSGSEAPGLDDEQELGLAGDYLENEYGERFAPAARAPAEPQAPALPGWPEGINTKDPLLDPAGTVLLNMRRRAAAAAPSYLRSMDRTVPVTPGTEHLIAASASDGDYCASEAARIVNRHSHLFGLAAADPAAAPASTSACPDPDCTDPNCPDGLPSKGGQASIDYYTRMAAKMFGSKAFTESPISGNQSTAAWVREADRT